MLNQEQVINDLKDLAVHDRSDTSLSYKILTTKQDSKRQFDIIHGYLVQVISRK